MRAHPPFTTARKAAAAVALALALALVLSAGSVGANAAKPTKPGGGGGGSGGGGTSEVAIPKSMAAAGDSISVATNHTLTCAFLGGCASASWTTGTNTTVDSHFLRLKDYNKRITTRNAAYSGATMANLNAQFSSIVSGGNRPGYVTVLIGANDLCGTSLTPTDTFRSQFRTAMTNLYATSPNTSVFVGSIPDLKRLYDLMKTNTSALSTWDRFDVCPLMLDPSLGMQGAVIEQQLAFNQILKEECARFAADYPNRCLFDDNAIFETEFLVSDISTVDYFHPSTSGQRKLSSIAWAASFWPNR